MSADDPVELILMRHAEAEPLDPAVYPDDAARPLTRHGRDVQRKVSKALKRLECKPDWILASPRVRARQTAEITAEVLAPRQGMRQQDALGGGYSVANALKMLLDFQEARCVLCVGHEPDLSELAGALLGPGRGPSIRFKKSAVLGLGFRAYVARGGAYLCYFYRPKDLLALV